MQHGRPCIELIVGGEHHDMNRVRLHLLQLLAEEDERTVVRCSADFGDGTALADTDFLITYTNNVIPEGATLNRLHAFVERGGRWLAIHGAAALTQFKPPAVDIGGIRLPGLTDTPDLAPDYMALLGARFISHLAPQVFTMHPTSVAHPVTDGLAPFDVIDEPYILALGGESVVLMDARYTGAAPGYVAGPWLSDDPRPQLVLHRVGSGEVLYLAPGHACGRYDLRPFIDDMPIQPGPWASPDYIELVRRLIIWGLEPTTR
ncbi:MAG: hypothetical protein RIS94_190 [Pseudomonadota bacterium]|jgi:type 1 glutamine amidotransferase